MKKKNCQSSYVTAEVEIIRFDSNDIVTASGDDVISTGGKVDGYWD